MNAYDAGELEEGDELTDGHPHWEASQARADAERSDALLRAVRGLLSDTDRKGHRLIPVEALRAALGQQP